MPAGLHYSPQLLHAARSGYTPPLSITELHAQALDAARRLDAAVQSIPAVDVDLSCEGMGVETPWQVLQRRLDEEVAAVADHLKAREAQAAQEKQPPQPTATEAEAETIEAKEAAPSTSTTQPSPPRRARKRKAASAPPAEEKTAAEPQGVPGEQEEAKADDKGVKAEGAGTAPAVRSRRRRAPFSSSLTSVSTATSPLHLSADLPLPDTFGSRMPSYAALLSALMPPAGLPLSLFPPVVDHNSITPELFLHRLQRRLSSLSPAPPLPPYHPLLHFHVYAASSERKAQELILHAGQPLSALTAAVRCPHPPSNAFLLLDRRLYTADPSAASPVVRWLTAHPTHPLYPPEVLPLDTPLWQLRVRLGGHAVYHHGADCCHVVQVGEVRFLDERWDVVEGGAYPLEVYVRHERKRKCGGCRLFGAEYAVYDDVLCVDTPTFLCDHCYKRLHYDTEGRLLYADFKVYKV